MSVLVNQLLGQSKKIVVFKYSIASTNFISLDVVALPQVSLFVFHFLIIFRDNFSKLLHYFL